MEMTTQDIQCYYKDKGQENRKTIFHFMLDGKEYTKQQVSVGTGLSVATCNTLLNEMEAQGYHSWSKLFCRNDRISFLWSK